MLKLYDHQKKDYDSIMESLETKDRVLYQLSTGGGKTVVVSQIVADLMDQEKTFLILVHKERLLRQMVATIKSAGLWVGHIIRNEHVNLDAMCIVASVGTVMNQGRIDLIKDREFDYIVIDEAHHAVSNSFTKVIDAANHGKACKIIGVTATPYRSDKKNLKDHFDELIVGCKPMRQLIQEEFLAQYKIAATPVKNLKNKVSKAGSDYKLSELSEFMREPETVKYLVESYKKHATGRKMICFCVDRAHAKQVVEAYTSNGFLKTTYIDAQTKPKEREAIFEGFNDGTYDIIVCIETLTEGVDLPECNCIQLGRPTLSLILFLQMVGRGLRPKEDGGDCVILDNAGCILEFGLPDSERNWQLDSDKNPVVPGDKVLVGRNSNGDLSDDLEGDEFDEIFEMDYDDFIESTIGDEETANQINKKADQDQKELAKGLVEKICSFFPNLEYGESWNNYYLRKKGVEDIIYLEIGYRSGMPSLKAKRNISLDSLIWVGKVAETITKEKLFDGFSEKYSAISKKHINIHKLKAKIEEKNLIKIENILVTNFEKGITEYIFEDNKPRADNLKNYCEGKIRKMEIISNPTKKNVEVKIEVDVYSYWGKNKLEEKEYQFKCQKDKIINCFKNYEFK